MKYLECTPLEKLKAFLESVDVGDYTVEGNLEAYSCKCPHHTTTGQPFVFIISN
jgi:hypothetical protein